MTSTLAAAVRGALAVCALLAGLAAAGCSEDKVARLPALGARTDDTSVSGISSGAYMAGQFQFAHGRLVTGAGIIAGGPYGCAQSLFADAMPGPGAAILNLSKAINGCMLNSLMMFGVPNTPQLIARAEKLAEEGRIDPLDSMRSDRVYLFTGSEDRTVVPPIVRAAAEFYGKIGVPADAIKLVESFPAGHAFVTEDKGLACDRTGKPFVVDCDYDQAGALLEHVYGKLKPRSAAPTGRFIPFDQNPFSQGLRDHGMAEDGVVYVPSDCETSPGCRVHIAFHGCAQNRETVGEEFITGTGFTRWADTNRMIILFPQVSAQPLNPQACWDWWGYTGSNFMTRDAAQIVAVHRMLLRLGEPRAAI